MQQQTREIDPSALAAGERADRGLEVHAAQQRLDDIARIGIRRPLVILSILQGGVADGGIVIQRITLVQHAEAQIATPGDLPTVGPLRFGEQPQQGGFAVAVAADDADAIAFEDPWVTSVNTVVVAKLRETWSSPRS